MEYLPGLCKALDSISSQATHTAETKYRKQHQTEETNKQETHALPASQQPRPRNSPMGNKITREHLCESLLVSMFVSAQIVFES